MKFNFVWFGLLSIISGLIRMCSVCGSEPRQRGTNISQTRQGTEMALKAIIPRFVMSGKDLPDTVNDLNRLASIPVNAILNVEQSKQFSSTMENVTLHDIVTDFADRTGSDWYHERNSIDIVEKSITQDRAHAMNTVLNGFEAVKKSKMEAAQELFTQPEILRKQYYINFFDVRTGGGQDKPLTLRLKEVTPRQVLDAIVEADGGSYWPIYS